MERDWPYDVPAESVRARCARHGLALLAINTVVGGAARGEFGLGALPGRERDFEAAIDQSIAYCKASGATAIHVMAGVVEEEHRARAADVFRANLAKIGRAHV